MKKIVVVLFLLGCSFCYGQEKKLEQTEKITCAFTGCIKTATGIWGFSQKNSYGNVTGVVFSISGIRDIYLAIRKEK